MSSSLSLRPSVMSLTALDALDETRPHVIHLLVKSTTTHAFQKLDGIHGDGNSPPTNMVHCITAVIQSALCLSNTDHGSAPSSATTPFTSPIDTLTPVLFSLLPHFRTLHTLATTALDLLSARFSWVAPAPSGRGK